MSAASHVISRSAEAPQVKGYPARRWLERLRQQAVGFLETQGSRASTVEIYLFFQ